MTSDSDTLDLARQLIKEESVSPDDGDCQEIIGNVLKPLGFTVENMPFGPVKNLWASKTNGDGPTLVFAGHTDVVPPGPSEEWQQPPYSATVVGDTLHGRGAADMKGSLAAMLTAATRFMNKHPNHQGTLGFLITSDEEDVAIDGTAKVMDELDRRGVKIDYCIVGEPSSSHRVGDVIRVGRRGSLNGRLTIRGIQGHVAYPQLARNPVFEFAPALAELAKETWDNGNEFFPATSFQISNINAGTGASNVIPGELTVDFNFRFSTESSEEDLKTRTEAILNRSIEDFSIEWRLSGPPFLTDTGILVPTVQEVIRTHFNIETELSTSGGTSDGRFIAPRGVELVELGPCNATIHKVNEQTSITELNQLSAVYEDIMRSLLSDG